MTFETNANYCQEVELFRDPGGSMFCPQEKAGSPTTAYEATYSFDGLPMASDEFGGTYYLFHIYFRPEELASYVRNALKNRKLSRAEKATYFRVSTSRENVRRVVIDEEQSEFCETTHLFGHFHPIDRNCREKIVYKTITTPSDFIAVRVDPIPAR